MILVSFSIYMYVYFLIKKHQNMMETVIWDGLYSEFKQIKQGHTAIYRYTGYEKTIQRR